MVKPLQIQCIVKISQSRRKFLHKIYTIGIDVKCQLCKINTYQSSLHSTFSPFVNAMIATRLEYLVSPL